MTLQEMRDIDVRTVEPDTLAEAKNVIINTSLPRDERMADYLAQVKNPYCVKVGKTVVKLSYSDTEATMEDCLERYLLSI